MKLQGSLAEHDFPRLVQDLHERQWTGVLTLTHAGVGKSVVVQEGRMVFASSSSRDERLGELMLRRGRISLRQLADAGKALVPGKRLGTVLVEQGALSPKDLVRSVVEHTQEIIYGAFQWTEGQYRLRRGRRHQGGDQAQHQHARPHRGRHPPDRLLDPHRPRRRRAHRPLRAHRGLRGQAPQRDPVPRRRWRSSPTSSAVRTVEQICESSTLPDFEVCRTLWAFRVVGAVKRLGESPDGAGRRRRRARHRHHGGVMAGRDEARVAADPALRRVLPRRRRHAALRCLPHRPQPERSARLL